MLKTKGTVGWCKLSCFFFFIVFVRHLHKSVCLFICLSVYLSVCLFVCLSICLSIFTVVTCLIKPACRNNSSAISLCVCPSVFQSIHLSVCQPNSLSVHLFVTHFILANFNKWHMYCLELSCCRQWVTGNLVFLCQMKFVPLCV